MKYTIFSLMFLIQCSIISPEKEKNNNASIAAVAVLASASSSSATEYSAVSGITSEHNKVRTQENAGLPSLSWDATVGAYSKSKVEYLANNGCQLSHTAGPTNPGYGENLFWGSGSSWTVTDAVTSWYSEKSNYTYSSNSCASGKVCGHYTQVVWKNSTKLGCYLANCPSNAGMIIGCNYDPPGNYNGQKPY
ncbi:MAG TPA: pathogenesis-related family 1 protein [Leptospiraceae bacterium]|nr:pathogenesis-related family 1 protein [Leptospiraceae bacterium]HMY66181.1 pathogenesis-related family 1 protein [Leptospiraceae bacterium]HMZ57339.1 pathogenesis-related family 1 protein [Leptospiraceae bacterium]HNF22931.1 pathogenesis-related family 1 protein [Leptospiraceae bacterium]HNH07056.1 pathogenesis-related family 1 protein [Leptospiraceae bacterium]